MNSQELAHTLTMYYLNSHPAQSSTKAVVERYFDVYNDILENIENSSNTAAKQNMEINPKILNKNR